MIETVLLIIGCGVLLLGIGVILWALFAPGYDDFPLPPAPTIFGDDDDGPEHKQ